MPLSGLAALAGILFGYDTGVISGAILFITSEFSVSASGNGLIVAAVLIGACLGAISSGPLTDRFGRRRLLLWDAVIFILGSLWSSLAGSANELIAARIVVGIAIGIASYTAPVYIAEVSRASQRGRMVSCHQLAVALGIFASYCVDYALASEGQWRLMLGLGAVPAAGLALAMMVLPESPRWLMQMHRTDDARSVLLRLGRSRSEMEQELNEISYTISQSFANNSLLFRQPYLSVLMLGISLSIMQQVTGINTIIYYAPTIFQLAGFTSARAAILATLGIGAILVGVSALAVPLVDKLGRKPLLFIGLVVMLASLLILAALLPQQGDELTSIQGFYLIAAMTAYVLGFGVSLGPVVWLLIAEIFPLQVRGLGCSIATCSNWVANGVVAVSFLPLVENFSLSTVFIFYALSCLASLFFVQLWVPETKGKSLESIEANLHAGRRCRELGHTTTTELVETRI